MTAMIRFMDSECLNLSMNDVDICAESCASKYPGCLLNVALQRHFDILQRHFDILQRHIDIWQRHMTSGSVIQSV